jgi:hypothetical protein
MKSALQELADWYASRCDGDWEHEFGFRISTIDNPGVSVDIDLRGTFLELVSFEEKKDRYDSETEWMICRRTEGKFEGRGSPCRLNDIVEVFLSWSKEKEPKKA